MFPFNVRVYGILIHEGRVLLCRESHRGRKLVKFPGGGLEFGEGPVDALVREFREELKLPVTVTEHLYTTHFFQRSAFDPRHQIISIYYLVRFRDEAPEWAERDSYEWDGRVFIWHDTRTLSADDLTLPIDKYVVPLIPGR